MGVNFPNFLDMYMWALQHISSQYQQESLGKKQGVLGADMRKGIIFGP